MSNASVVPFRNMVARQLSFLSACRGWVPLIYWLAGPSKMNLDVGVVSAFGRRFKVDLSSYVEWNIYNFCGYERAEIASFIRLLDERPGVLLDIGSNVGNHALALAAHATSVHAFEPNPPVFARLKANVNLNPEAVVHLNNAGLGDQDGELLFFQPPQGYANQGMGTFVREEAPPNAVELKLPILVGDDYVSERLGGERVAGIKADVQGFEAAVLRGLQKTIRRDRPLLWIEVSDATRREIAPALFPDGSKFFRLGVKRLLGLYNRMAIDQCGFHDLMAENGNYLIVTAE